MSALTKVTFNLTPAAADALDFLAGVTLSRTDALNRSLLLARRLETIAPGGEFVVILPDGSRHRIVQLT
ncbi:hypothetical protein [Micromonospora sp. NPDC004704]